MSLETRSHRGAAKDPGATELFLSAARSGNFRQAVEAIAQDADLFATTARAQNALMLASGATREGARDMVAFLVEVRMEVEAKDEKGWTALLFACRNNNRDTLEYLLALRADLSVRTHAGETAPMLTALEPSSDRLVINLVGKRASIHPKDERGYNLLFYAAELGRDELARWLLRKNANVKEKSIDKTTAMMIAASTGNGDLVKRLYEAKASLNSKNIEGFTPLMYSLVAMQEKVTLWLIEEHANVVQTNSRGETAMDLAKAGDLVTVVYKIEQAQRRHAQLLIAEAEEKKAIHEAQLEAAAKAAAVAQAMDELGLD